MTAESRNIEFPADEAGRQPARRGTAWALAVLTAIFTVAFIDRQILNLLVDPIKGSLGITDVDFSLLQGLAFMASYVALSPMFGWLADRTTRRNLLAGAVTVWSLCTILCGLTQDYSTLFMARIGIGAAEACVTPAAWSMLADLYERKRLSRALSIFLIGPYIGTGLAMILGGFLLGIGDDIRALVPIFSGFADWQIVFIAVGLPGIMLGPITLALREPARGESSIGPPTAAIPLREAFAFLWQARSFFVLFFLGMTAIILVLYSVPAWMPAVLIRSLDADPATVGLQYGIVALCAGTGGVLFGPVLGRFLAARGTKYPEVRVPIISAGGLVVAGALLAFLPCYEVGLLAAGLATFFFGLPQAMAATALQVAAPPAMRGLVASIYTFIAGVIGLVLAPTLVAFLTDHVFRDPADVDSSLAIVCCTSAIIALFLTIAAARNYRPLTED